MGREERRFAAYSHACSTDQGLVRNFFEVAQIWVIENWRGFGGVEARLTCNTCSLPVQRALYSSLSNRFPLFEYVALLLHVFFPRDEVY